MRFALPSPLRRALPLAALTVLSLVTLQAEAQWKWRDKDGQVNASDRPPPRDIPEKDVLSRPLPDGRRLLPVSQVTPPAGAGSAPLTTAAPAVPAKGPLDRELEARKRGAEQEQSAKAKAEEERNAQQRAENCRRARTHVAALETGQRIARVNDKGEREVLDDRGRADELRQARSTIASDCK